MSPLDPRDTERERERSSASCCASLIDVWKESRIYSKAAQIPLVTYHTHIIHTYTIYMYDLYYRQSSDIDALNFLNRIRMCGKFPSPSLMCDPLTAGAAAWVHSKKIHISLRVLRVCIWQLWSVATPNSELIARDSSLRACIMRVAHARAIYIYMLIYMWNLKIAPPNMFDLETERI